MTETEREMRNHVTAMQGEQPCVLKRGGVLRPMRRVSAESLSVLQLVGSPFAVAFNAALNNEVPREVKPLATDVAVMAWVHSAPEDEVLAVALDCLPGHAAPAVEAALRYVRGWSIQETAEVLEYALAELASLRAASFDAAAPEYGEKGGKKNV